MTKRGLQTMILFGGLVAVVASPMLMAGGGRKRPERPGKPPRDVTLTGKLVDLQSFMSGRFADEDPARATQNSIRAGVPAALETENGLIVLGMGERGPARILLPLAYQNVEVKGRLYERTGLRYIDISTARVVTDGEGEVVEDHDAGEGEEESEEESEEDSEEEEPEEEP